MGPLSTPDNLPMRLQYHGLREGAALVGMVLDAPDLVAQDHPWRVERVALDVALGHAESLASAYGMGMIAESFGHVLRAVASSAGSAVCVAEDRATGAVVGYGVSVPLGARVVFLSGSATVPAFRGQGVYRAQVGARLRDAFATGVEAALITAVSRYVCPNLCAAGISSLLHHSTMVWKPSRPTTPG